MLMARIWWYSVVRVLRSIDDSAIQRSSWWARVEEGIPSAVGGSTPLRLGAKMVTRHRESDYLVVRPFGCDQVFEALTAGILLVAGEIHWVFAMKW